MAESIAPPASGSPPGPPPPRSRRTVLAAVAIVVAVAVIVAALVATGVLGLGSTSAGPSANETFLQASGTAQSGANPVAGAPWYGILAGAIVTRNSVLEPTTNLSSLIGNGNCTVAWVHGEPANVAIPATPAGAGTGTSAYWLFVFKNVSNDLLIVTVASGDPTALATLGGPDCEELGGFFDSFGSGLEDSNSIVAAANAAGGGAFLREYPNATQAWFLVGTVDELTLPLWTIEDTSCTLPTSVSAHGAFFNATVIATTATLRGSPANGTADCALSFGTGASLARALPPSAPAALRKAI